jgi:hypothetical protein
LICRVRDASSTGIDNFLSTLRREFGEDFDDVIGAKLKEVAVSSLF